MKPIVIEECACVVGRITDHPRSMWIVREPITGFSVSNPADTRREAIANATKRIQAAGGKEMFDYAIQSAKHQTPADS